MSLLEKVNQRIKDAMKTKDVLSLEVLRSIKVSLDKFLKDNVKTQKPLDEAAETKILETLSNQRLDSFNAFMQAGRTELAKKESDEKLIIDSFLPQPASELEVKNAVDYAIETTGATEIKQMSNVLKVARERLTGLRVDGALLASYVKTFLSGKK